MTKLRHGLAACALFLANTANAFDPSLVASWRFDEGAGAIAYDSSPNFNAGAILGASWTDGLVGRALSFDGSASNVRVPSTPSLDLTTGLTIEAWVKLESNGGARVIASKWDDVNGEWSYIFKKHNSQAGLRMELSQNVHTDLADLAGNQAVPLGRWVHVATTYDREMVRLYVNGVEDAAAPSWTVPGTIDRSAADLLIGAVNPGNASEVFHGLIDQVSVFARALTAGELAVRYAALAPLADPAVVLAGVDVKPGAYPNEIKLGANGTVPVAVLGSAALDVTRIVAGSVTFAGAPVALRKNGSPMVSIADVNLDGFMDLVAHFRPGRLALTASSEVGMLEAQLQGGGTLRGADSVIVVP